MPQGTKPTGTVATSLQCALYPTPGTACRSPDGAWSVTYKRGQLLVARRGQRGVRAYQSDSFCCDYITWAKPHTLLFDDDYQLMRLDPVTRKHRTIAGWSDFVVSPDGRWIAGWGQGSEISPERVGVRSVEGKTCLVVPRDSHQKDEAAGFTQDSKNVIVKRWPYEPDNGATGPSQLVQYAISSLPTSKDC
jgi:hypothetical protein